MRCLVREIVSRGLCHLKRLAQPFFDIQYILFEGINRLFAFIDYWVGTLVPREFWSLRASDIDLQKRGYTCAHFLFPERVVPLSPLIGLYEKWSFRFVWDRLI